jgi:hypothetical protein
VVNGLAIVLSAPLILLGLLIAFLVHQIPLVPLALALLLGIMPNPGAAGLQFCARQIARDEPVSTVDMRRALGAFWKPASALYAFSLVALILIAANVIFYAALNSPVSPFLELIWVYLFVTWLMAQVYLYPMLLAVDRPSVPVIYRNSLVLAFRKPFSTMIVLVFWLFVLILCSATGLVIVLGLIVAAIMQQALLLRLLPTVSPAPREASSAAGTNGAPDTQSVSRRSRKRRRR